MKDLNLIQQQAEYVRVMKDRMTYYANKYDPHTVFYDPKVLPVNETPADDRIRRRGTLLRSFFLNIF